MRKSDFSESYTQVRGRWEEADCKGGSSPTVPRNLRERFSESIASTLSNLSYA